MKGKWIHDTSEIGSKLRRYTSKGDCIIQVEESMLVVKKKKKPTKKTPLKSLKIE